MKEQHKRTKILYVITKSNWGGAQRYVYDLATSLSKDSYEVTVALGGSGILEQKLAEANIHVILVQSLVRDINPLKDIMVFFAFLRLIKNEKPHILHVNSSKAGGLGAVAGRVLGVPLVIFTAHGWEFNNPTRNIITRSLIMFFSWLTMFLSHRTIAVSENMRRQVDFFPFVFKKTTTIHNGIDAVHFLERETARRELLSHDNSLVEAGIWVGTVAELHPVKGISVAIDAIKNIVPHNPRIHFVILGEGELHGTLEKNIEKKELVENVHLLGFFEDAARRLLAFDIFLLPSVSEGLAYALLEAGKAGLPTVASRVGGIPEIIEDGKTGILVRPGDVEGITDALLSLIRDKEKRGRFGAALKEKVDREFSLKQMVEKTVELYRSDW